ncbi:hypothetical protein SDC9_124349 [bioreactor metagenome]|uniref:Uncharacterized protein n=1 Tax=bioreactor metagenome TaxID=1076179 RepID=A0A645CK58_9ZZZZ
MIPPQRVNDLSNFDDLLRVEAARRFVENDIFRIAAERLGNADALAIALGEIADQAILHVLQPDLIENALEMALDLPLRHAHELADEHQILVDGHLRVERRELRHVAQVTLCFERFLEDVVPVDPDVSLVRGDVSGYDIHRSGFARAVAPDEADDLSLVCLEGYAAHRQIQAVSLV